MTTTPRLIAATATRTGTADDNADSAYVYTAGDGTVGAAVIDGIGHSPGTSDIAPVLATVAARVAAIRGPLAGLLSAAQLVTDGGPDGDGPDAVGVAAHAMPGGDTIIDWVGDCDAYGWNPETRTLTRYTTPHTMGQTLRVNGGVPVEIAQTQDNWVLTSLARSTVATVYRTVIPDPLVILTSDGVHDQMTHEKLETLVREHADDQQALADTLVAAAQADPNGYRDDATVAVISNPHTS